MVTVFPVIPRALRVVAPRAMVLDSPAQLVGYEADGLTYAHGTLSLNLSGTFLSNGILSNLLNAGILISGRNLAALWFTDDFGVGYFGGVSGNWTYTNARGADWTFSQATGVLTMNVVPEPGTGACLSISLGPYFLFSRPKNKIRAAAGGGGV